MARSSELRSREVVNISDGRRLGLINDFEIDMATGQIKAIVVPGPSKLIRIFTRSEDQVIPWERIIKIGVDVILVEALGGTLEQNKGNLI
ncbi:MAG: YlmC/YmxH family sporulation protein [Bacillota bacterium]